MAVFFSTSAAAISQIPSLASQSFQQFLLIETQTRNRKNNNNKSLISNSNHISFRLLLLLQKSIFLMSDCSFVGIYYIFAIPFSILLFAFQHFMKREAALKIVNMELKRGEKRVCLLLNNSAAEINVFDLDMVFREEIKRLISHLRNETID